MNTFKKNNLYRFSFSTLLFTFVCEVSEHMNVIDIIHGQEIRNKWSSDFVKCDQQTLSTVKETYMCECSHSNVELNDIVELFSNSEDDHDVYVLIK